MRQPTIEQDKLPGAPKTEALPSPEAKPDAGKERKSLIESIRDKINWLLKKIGLGHYVPEEKSVPKKSVSSSADEQKPAAGAEAPKEANKEVIDKIEYGKIYDKPGQVINLGALNEGDVLECKTKNRTRYLFKIMLKEKSGESFLIKSKCIKETRGDKDEKKLEGETAMALLQPFTIGHGIDLLADATKGPGKTSALESLKVMRNMPEEPIKQTGGPKTASPQKTPPAQGPQDAGTDEVTSPGPESPADAAKPARPALRVVK